MSPREMFQKAKVQHYLDQVEEQYHLSRFFEARRIAERAVSIDPQNRECIALRRAVEQSIQELAGRMNGGSAHVHREGRSPGRKDLVMLVDQDERVLLALTRTLHRHGYQVIGATSYEEAQEVLTQTKPDAVVSEVNFAEGSRGFDLFSFMRRAAETANIPFLFTAVRLDPEVLIAGKRLGVDDFIVKPFDNEVVAVSIQQCLQRRRLTAAHG
jgi:PleD family two-component response regulator